MSPKAGYADCVFTTEAVVFPGTTPVFPGHGSAFSLLRQYISLHADTGNHRIEQIHQEK